MVPTTSRSRSSATGNGRRPDGDRSGPRPGRPRDERLDHVIVTATAAEVSEKGWGAATIDGIAARAKVSKATIYRRWRSKDELLHFVASRVVDDFDAPDTGDLRLDLLAIFRPMAEHLADANLEMARMLPMLVAEATQSPTIRDVVRQAAQQRRRPALDAIDRAIARGEVAPDTDGDAVVDMAAGALVYRLLLLGEPITPATVDQIVAQTLRGVLAPTRTRKST